MPLQTKSSKAFPQIAEQFPQQYLEAIFSHYLYLCVRDFVVVVAASLSLSLSLL